jgi:hypothetical protein
LREREHLVADIAASTVADTVNNGANVKDYDP